MVNWLPAKGERVAYAAEPGSAAYVLVRRLGEWDERNEHWLARDPRGRLVSLAVGEWWVRWEGGR